MPLAKAVRPLFSVLSSVILIGGMAAGVNAGSAQSLSFATDRAGTTFNVIGTGLGKVIEDNTQLRMSIRPFAGPDAYLPMVESGEMDSAAVSAFSVWQSFNAIGIEGEPLKQLRVLRSGAGSLYVGLIARADSEIHEVADLRGARLASSFGGHIAVTRSLDAALRSAGLTFDDVTQVPVVGIVDGIDALVAGRVDATWVSYGQPQVREAHTRIGVRYLPLPDGNEALAVMREAAFPGVQLNIVPADSSFGAEQEMPLMTYDSYLLANETMDEETVRTILEALWNHEDQLGAIHRALGGFTNDNAVTDVPVAPYHPAAVAFYREKGVWSEQAEEAQRNLLAGE